MVHLLCRQVSHQINMGRWCCLAELLCYLLQVYGITATSLLNFAVSDGATMLVTRFVWPEAEQAATLYYAEGE